MGNTSQAPEIGLPVVRGKDSHMPSRIIFLAFTVFLIAMCSASTVIRGQNSFTELHKLLSEQVEFESTDFTALENGHTVVKLLPVNDRREVAVSGLVRLNAPTELFLEFYRKGMFQKNNTAILEMGKFSNPPKLDDLRSLTIEAKDIEDMRNCVVGNCDVKLSAAMIGRLHREINWEAPDYQLRASELMKLMLLEYVQDYLQRGDHALLEYSDKSKQVRLIDEHQSLLAESRYLRGIDSEFADHLRSFPKIKRQDVEHAIVWSKVKFGLKPVIAVNHTILLKSERETGPKVLIASKQIYANHYFNSSLGLTAVLNVQNEGPELYLLYENRSRVDGLQGAFSGFKRRIVENEAVSNLSSILQQSKTNLEARARNPEAQLAVAVQEGRRPSRWLFGGIHAFWWFFWISAVVALLGLRAYEWNIRGEQSP